MRFRSALPLLFLASGCADYGSASGAPPLGRASNEGDKYTAVGTNPFVMAAFDPFSTFAVDVDTASYDIFRRDIEAGSLPQPDSVRLEEYVNSFEYAYDAPAHGAAVPFAISLGGAPTLTSTRTSIVRIGIQAASPPPSQRLPTNLVFLIDTSCSMQGADRLGLVQRVVLSAAAGLNQGDTVSIVTYAGSVGVALDTTPASNRAAIDSAVQNLQANGGTAGAAGIDLAYAQAQAGFIQGGFNHVILCTDGDFNVGASSDDALVDLIKSKRATGITLTALGFGTGNLNDSMMEKVSNAGNGFYSMISSLPQAERYGSTGLFSTIEIIARDMKVQVEFNPAHIEAYRLLGYENRLIADEDFDNDLVDGGEIASGHRVTALYEIVRAGEFVPSRVVIATGTPVEGTRTISPNDAVTIRVRYKQPMATDADAASEVSASLAPSALAVNAAGDPDTQFAAAVAAFAEILKGSPFADDTLLPEIQATAQAQAARDDGRAEFARLVVEARRLLGR